MREENFHEMKLTNCFFMHAVNFIFKLSHLRSEKVRYTINEVIEFMGKLKSLKTLLLRTERLRDDICYCTKSTQVYAIIIDINIVTEA